MSAQPSRQYPHRSALALLAGALIFGGAQAPALVGVMRAPAAMRMHMHMRRSTSEHVAEAVAGLAKGKVDEARMDLRHAVQSQSEPMDARMHARGALAAPTNGDRAMAEMHASNGAATEPLTYALRALRNGQTNAAGGHLSEALAIPKVRVYPRGDRRRAPRRPAGTRRAISAGLTAANRE